LPSFSHKKMNKELIKKVLKIAVFFLTGVVLFWIAYKDVDMNRIISSIKDANLWWFGVGVILSLASHLSRAVRWNIMIQPLGHNPRLANTFMAVMIMYLANLALPRLGEISRVGIMTKYEKVPFTKLLGTVVLERVVDMVMLLLTIVLVVLLEYETIINFLIQNTGSRLDTLMHYWWVILLAGILGLAMFLAVWYGMRKYTHISLVSKLEGIRRNFSEGIKTILTMQNKGWFIFHSFLIFFLYFFTLYVTFQAFEFTSHLSMGAALTVFTMSSLGMVAPAPGGIGAWHFMAYSALALYGVAIDPYGAAFAFAAHGAMTLLLIVSGALSLMILPVYNKA